MNQSRWSALPVLLSLSAGAAVVPNPRISVGKPVQASPSSNATLLVDGRFGSAWNYATGSWAAVRVGTGPSKVLVTWNDASGNWSDAIPSAGVCQAGTTFPTSYRILTSSNSTNGSDGTWDTLARVTGNVAASRAHVLDFAGASWVKMLVLAGSGRMDELEVYDASSGAADSWFFMGTSITMMTFKSSIADSSFADLVHARVPANTPALVRGGVPCINTGNVVASLGAYLDHMAGSRYLAVEMGTNDAWGGGSWNLENFTRNLQTIIDSARGRGMEPILARVLATDSARAGWQVHPGYPRAIDSLAKRNGLIAGPDLDGWFRSHPWELNSDGVHPSAVGGQSIQRLWAEAMARNLYATSSGVGRGSVRIAAQPLEGRDVLGRAKGRGAVGVWADPSGPKVRLPRP